MFNGCRSRAIRWRGSPAARTAPMRCRSTPVRNAVAATARARPSISIAPTCTAATVPTSPGTGSPARATGCCNGTSTPSAAGAMPAVGRQARIPYTRTIHVARRLQPALRRQRLVGRHSRRLRPALHARRSTRAVEAEAKPLKDDPFLIGYFIDNELGWGNGALGRSRGPLRAGLLGARRRCQRARRACQARAACSCCAAATAARSRSSRRPGRSASASWEALEGALAAAELPDGRIAGSRRGPVRLPAPACRALLRAGRRRPRTA